MRKFVRQLTRPKKESYTSPLNKIQSFTEAYDIIPKSTQEIDELDTPHNKENLKGLFSDIVKKSGVNDPIAISKNPKES